MPMAEKPPTPMSEFKNKQERALIDISSYLIQKINKYFNANLN